MDEEYDLLMWESSIFTENRSIMNRKHLQQIIDHYLSRFEELNGPVHMEYYKWQIAYRFKTLMDEALNGPIEEFPARLNVVKTLTENLIDSYTQPFNGLVEFSKIEPETVREMFRKLLRVAEAETEEKQTAYFQFLDESHRLRDKYYPDSYRYNDDLHSVTAYLFLYDPEHNYLYKPSHCRDFADCIEFYDDWGYGTDTKLDIFFRMCDEVCSFIKGNEPLMLANAGRYDIDPNGMHPDREKHILLFDLIYCCSAYGLFDGISYMTPKTGERKLLQERKEKAQELASNLTKALEQLERLNTATDWLKGVLQPGAKIRHKTFGGGIIQEITDKTITVHFPDYGKKILGIIVCVGNGLISLGNEENQTKLLSYQDLFRKDEQIRNAVQMAERDYEPYAEYYTPQQPI